jgi:hypothetical protein
MNTGYRTVTRPWALLGNLRVLNPGDLVQVEAVNDHTGSAMLHVGGMIRIEAMQYEIEQNSRESEPHEYQKTLRRCPACGKIEVQPGKWHAPPACFTPRTGVSLVDHRCPECDK